MLCLQDQFLIKIRERAPLFSFLSFYIFLSCTNPSNTPYLAIKIQSLSETNSLSSMLPTFVARNPHEEASSSMANITTAPLTYNGEANFDGNMVIVLAALLCALLCALGLNSIVRCFLRCGATHEASATGVEKAASSRIDIPAVVYAAALHTPATDCPICLGDFVEGEEVRFFPRCNHGFHVKCIDKWLLLHSSCPTCRQPLLEHVRIQIN